MGHPLVSQLKFARSEFQRSLEGVTDEEARKRFLPMNCISWMVGHLAAQEQRYWCDLAQGNIVAPGLYEVTASGQPGTTPPLDEMRASWSAVVAQSDVYLDRVSREQLAEYFMHNGKPVRENIGTMLLRNIYHYWFHNGELQAVRQMLGHTDLPQFVGAFNEDTLYRPEE